MNRALREALAASPQGRALLAAQEQEKRDRRARAKTLRKRGRAPGLTKAQRDAAWDEFAAWVRSVVWGLSGGGCERCSMPLSVSLGDLDHVKGGAYRKEFTRIDWTRRLCRPCHDERTATTEPGWWLAQMDSVRVRRIREQGAERIAALREEESRRLDAALHPTFTKEMPR